MWVEHSDRWLRDTGRAGLMSNDWRVVLLVCEGAFQKERYSEVVDSAQAEIRKTEIELEIKEGQCQMLVLSLD